MLLVLFRRTIGHSSATNRKAIAEGAHVDAATVTRKPIVRRQHHHLTISILIALLFNDSFIVSTVGEYYNDANNDRGLFPPTFNLASTASITANATCGEDGEETFCKLVEHVREPQCGVCDAKSSNYSRRHPITNAIDGTNQWWQSPSLQNGRQYEWATITLDLHQVYQVAYVIVKAANSPRPGNWILERSIDGETYLPWQYYAISESECIEIYGVYPTVGIPRYRSDDEVICTAYYSRLEPLENGEIHTSLVKGRPGVSGPSGKLQEFTSARFVRLRFQKIRSLHADLMTVTTRDWEKVHKTVTRRLFYSIKDISIGGQCMCFGHAQDCRSDQSTRRQKCYCVHNTCGDSCEKCCDLYNQKPWRLGTSTDAGLCEKCQCFGHADKCRYDKDVAIRKGSLNIEGHYEGGGVCVGCKDFTTGINCEKCLDGYFRSFGVPPDASHPCLKCNCSGLGTSGHCIKNDSLIKEGKNPGDCICREGFTGATCSQCDIGYRNYPICDLCPCNFAGTANTECEGECICKGNVDGVRCDHCKPGHFNLDKKNPKGCRKCYCSGATSRCVSADLGIQVLTSREGWQVSDVLGQKMIRPTQEGSSWTVASDDMTDHEAYFWLAPEHFTGHKLNSYGGEVQYNISWVKARGDSAGWLTSGPALVLDGGGLMIAYWGIDDIVQNNIDVLVTVKLTEKGWTHFNPDMVNHPKKIKRKDLKPVTRKAFMDVLLTVDRFLIQAKYHTDQIVGKLNSVSIEIGAEDIKTVRQMKDVERCHCPEGYAGLSCENCAGGFRRVNNTGYGGKCEKCNCNGHVTSCDPYTGACHECLHHTTGDNCDRCIVGYYGFASHGTPNDCKKCACPLEDSSNNWSDTCTAVNLNGTIDYVCDNCAIGYTGDKCEKCSDGYFGNLLIPGNYCQPCQCYGFPNGSVRCDHLTGRCVDCLGNREGYHCELCKDGYWGDPLTDSCQACKCDPFGSEDPTKCDKTTGQCKCRQLYDGQRCDRCIDNYGNVEAGCHSCQCSLIGSSSPTCDPVSGQCQCRIGVFGTKCDRCQDDYFGFSGNGCTWCNCSANGTLSTVCDQETGQCPCAEHVTGQFCNKCQAGYWNLAYKKGCQQCQCNSIGSVNFECDSSSGQCKCKEGVGGKDCGKCLPGYFGYSESGCRKCDECDLPGHLCDPWTGDCVCPPLTTGPSCQECQKNSWGFNQSLGCQVCNCNRDGSTFSQCDKETGQCNCRMGYEGRQCDSCRFGYFDFPDCKRCKCHLDGTDPSKCRLDGHCECSEDGQCPCKINVEGKKCRRCQPGTFGRTPIQEEGCTECFCFGKSSRCRQADFTWIRLRMPKDRILSVVVDVNHPASTKTTDWITAAAETCYINLAHLDSRKAVSNDHRQSVYIVHGLRVIPKTTGDLEVSGPVHINAPLYWKLPETLQGDLVASYNGHLRFRVGSEGGQKFPTSVLETYPMVLIQGNYRLVLEHYQSAVGSDGFYDVHLHESHWRFKNNPDVPVDRATMMVTLQRVQHILIRATERTDFTSTWLTNVSVDVVAASNTPYSSVIAIGIEICQCPPQYNGTSCQDPANGYYRFRKNDSLDSKDILDLVGVALPCPCNGRSKDCDKETGICKNCQYNTSGNYCERCADGFYGDPALGPCKPCACPTLENNFSDRCMLIGSTLTCTNCHEGHYGNQCERCMHGFYGNPLVSGGKCLPCSCDVRGSLGNVCDQNTGQCICIEGLTGRDCSICPRRHVLTNHGCHSCQDECTGLLLDDFEEITMDIMAANTSGVNPAPWGRLSDIENKWMQLRGQVDIYQQSLSTGRQLANDFDHVFNLGERADKQLLKILELQRNSSSSCTAAAATHWNAKEFLKKSDLIQQLIAETVRRLKEYAAGVDKVSVQLSDAVREAEMNLEKILGIDFRPLNEEAQKELRKAKMLLERVQNMIFDPRRMNELTKRLQKLAELLNDAQSHIPKNINDIRMRLEDNRSRFNRSKEMFGRAEEVTNETMLILDEAAKLVKEANEFMKQTQNNTRMLADMAIELDLKTVELEKIISFLAQKLPGYVEKVRNAEKHADDLLALALQLASLFNATYNESQMAMTAVNAYGDLAKLINSAKEVALMANDTAKDCISMVRPVGQLNISMKAKNSKQISEDLLTKAMNLEINELQNLQQFLMKLESMVKKTNITNFNNSLNLMNLVMEIDKLKLETDIKEDSKDYNQKSAKAKRISDQVKMRLKPISGTLSDRIEQAKKLALASNETIWNLTNKVNETMEKMFGLNADTTKREFDTNKDGIQNMLNSLKQNITNIRQGSATWLLGLGSEGNCNRVLHHNVKSPSFTNTLSFYYSISTTEVDSFILYLGNRDMKEYLAVEMVNRTMVFEWDAGGGPVKIAYDLLRIETDDPEKTKSFRYKVEAQRIGNRGSIRVRNVRNSTWPGIAENINFKPFNFINFGPDSNLMIGRTPGNSKKAFHGCLSNLRLDEQSIGLWNYIETANCKGCKADSETRMLGFQAGAYAILKFRRPLDNYIILTFRTFNEDGLLLFASDERKHSFFAVYLSAGRVILKFQLCNVSEIVTVTTDKTYNNNQFISLQLVQKGHVGSIRVGDELKHNLSKGSCGEKNTLFNPIYIGGVPPNFNFTKWKDTDVIFKPFYGCMESHIQVDGKHTMQLVGITYECPALKANRILVGENGFLEMKGFPLTINSSIGFSIKSASDFSNDKNKNLNAVLLLSTFLGVSSATSTDFYNLVLQNGQFALNVNGAAGKSNKTIQFSNNETNHVFIRRSMRNVELHVNDQLIQSINLRGNNVIESGRLFIGGINPNISTAAISGGQILSAESFRGIFYDVHFNNMPLLMNESVNRFNVTQGQSFPKESFLQAPVKKLVKRCAPKAQIGQEPRALNFGDSNNSYASVDLKKRKYGQRFNITFDFRTHYPDGLLLIVVGEKRKVKRGKSTPFLTISMDKGNIKIDGSSSSKIISGSFHNGQWHKVRLKQVKRKIELIVGSKKDVITSDFRKPRTVNFGSIVSQIGSPSPKKSVIPAFKGCIRNFQVNDDVYDLSSAKQENVRACFSNVEAGSWFGGDAYALYDDNFAFGPSIEIELQFRTTETNGVLISFRDKGGSSGLQLGLIDQNLTLRVILANGEQWDHAVDFENMKYYVCDDRWHNVTATYSDGYMDLRVDEKFQKVDEIQNKNNHLGSGPLYIGGLPESFSIYDKKFIRDNFKGCIRNVVIRGHIKDWIDMSKHNVLLNSCYLQQNANP
ncbi:hypothetical protein CHUAL_007531 [Chamberlinius hualienensis]